MLTGLALGDTLLRREVHMRFGGRRQGGIGPSSLTPVVLFFTDPATGHRHGYYDGWDDQELFNYVGEGQVGDQRLVQGNKAILNHIADGRSLEGFAASGPKVTYLGEFSLVDHYFTDAHETGGDVIRQVVVFRLRPHQVVPVSLSRTPFTVRDRVVVETVPVEDRHTERSHVMPDREAYDMERRESALVHRYEEHLRGQGHIVSRLRVLPPGETAPLFSDLWVESTRDLVQAKASVSRDHARAAVGQLLDYGRFVDANTRTLLVPGRPRPDLVGYLHSAGIDVVFPEGPGWECQGRVLANSPA
jgi:hypothetical protein